MFQIGRMISLLALVLAAAAPALAQNAYPYNVDTRPKTGFLPDSMVGGVDSIGPANGGLHLNIPIASLPAGAAGMGFELRLVYNSAIYSIDPGVWEDPPFYVDPEDLEGDEQYPKYYQDLRTGRGWRYNFQNYRIEEEKRTLLQSEEDCEGGFPWHPRATRMRAGLGDGSLHALHLYGYGRTAEFGLVEPEGFYPYDIHGDVNRPSPECNNPGGYPNHLHDVRRTFYSSDGSYVKLEEGPNSNVPNEWILYLPDGGQARGTGSLATKLYDANGNWVEIVNGCGDLYCSLPYTAIRDPYYAADPNRQILIEYVSQPTGPSDHQITAPTANGTATWTVDLARVRVDGGVKTYEKTLLDHPADTRDGDQAVHARSHLVVASIAYPTSPATSYRFGYNDAAEGWGELDEMTAPSGAVTAYTYQNASHRSEGDLLGNRIEERTVRHDGTTDTWTYAYSGDAFQTTHPDGSVVTKTFENSDRERIWKIVRTGRGRGGTGLGLELDRRHRRLRPVDRQPLREAGTPDRAQCGRQPIENRHHGFHLQPERIVDFAHRVRLGELWDHRRGDDQTQDRPFVLLPRTRTRYRPRTRTSIGPPVTGGPIIPCSGTIPPCRAGWTR